MILMHETKEFIMDYCICFLGMDEFDVHILVNNIENDDVTKEELDIIECLVNASFETNELDVYADLMDLLDMYL